MVVRDKLAKIRGENSHNCSGDSMRNISEIIQVSVREENSVERTKTEGENKPEKAEGSYKLELSKVEEKSRIKGGVAALDQGGCDQVVDIEIEGLKKDKKNGDFYFSKN
ncbi:hypothetical protein ACH5RR_032258 [Cinchona calisaya]|uniref:Uncharacterized protein n=1 Tax=Cinchona calisaya TaxID=153742 RepID=A0ABD2YJI9_9GENT